MICEAVIAGEYRYKLIRRWRSDIPALIWVMLNPSTADHMKDDATIRKCIGFSMNNGYGGIEVYNLFAFRSTDPLELKYQKDPVGPENDRYLQEIPAGRPVVAAWGVLPHGMPGRRELDVIQLLRDRDWRCFGLTLQGYPRHPVRLAYAEKLELLPLVEVALTFSLRKENQCGKT